MSNNKLNATFHPMYPCATCGASYPSYLAALDCADQDELEADDRNHGRLYR